MVLEPLPGARCDVESVDYSYSFDEGLQDDWTWSERFAAQPEILAYLDHVADRLDLRHHYRFETEVVGARFESGEWVVDTSTGESHRGRFLLCATGCLSAVNRPDIPGLSDFAGEVYYSAAWPRDDPDLRGKKIGVIGTGSSGIQAMPILAEEAETSVLEANDIARWFAEDRIREIVTDPAVAEDLIPTDHPIGTKRICTDAGYYATFNRDNVRLMNLRREPIEAVTTDGVRTALASYPCDVLVFATGFDALTGAMTRIDPIGPGGQRLSEIWVDGPVTFLGVMVPRLPNLFSFSGPGSPSVLANMVLHAEVQVDWAVGLVRAMRRRGITEVEPRRDAARAWTDHVAEAAERTLFPKAQSSRYLGANIEGKKRVFMPYAGGFGNYRRYLDDAAEQGYSGLVLTTR